MLIEVFTMQAACATTLEYLGTENNAHNIDLRGWRRLQGPKQPQNSNVPNIFASDCPQLGLTFPTQESTHGEKLRSNLISLDIHTQ